MAKKPEAETKRKAGRRHAQPKHEVPFESAIPFWTDVVACYEKKRRLTEPEFQFAAVDIDGVVDNVSWCRIRTGTAKVSPEKVVAFRNFFGECFDPHECELAYAEKRVLDLERWKPEVGTFDWPPFCDAKGTEGFLVDATRRFFQLAGKVATKAPVFRHKPFAYLLSGAGVQLSLALAETIARTRRARIFHTPCVMGVNLVGLFNDTHFRAARDLLTNSPGSGEPLHIVTVAGEVGDEYIKSLPLAVLGRIKHRALPGDAEQDPGSEIKRRIEGNWLYCADELSCLLKLGDIQKAGGLLFPLGTRQVARSEQYARLPIYKVGLFTVPEYQREIIGFLEKALRVYLENELEETSQRYVKLYEKLIQIGLESLDHLSESARKYLYEAHVECGDDFYVGLAESEIRNALADRWTRRSLRLYPQQTVLGLNLPWQPILTRARELVPPVANQTRTPGERRVVAMYRELPPVITPPHDGRSGFSVFEAVLGPLRPHLELAEAKRYERKQTDSQLGSDGPSTVAVGFFAIPPRLFDWRFFRFPIELKFAGVLLGEADPDQSSVCEALLKGIESGRHQEKYENLSTSILLLHHGAVHNLLRDHNLNATCFRFIDDTGGKRGAAFVEAAQKERAAVVIADELTCLEVVGAVPKGHPVRLLNHRLTSRSTDELSAGGPYFSMAVRRSAPDWIHFFEQAVPLSLQTYRHSIAEAHADLYRTLKRWTEERVNRLGMEQADPRVAWWCRSVLLLDRAGELAPEWDPILARAKRLVDGVAPLGTHA